MTAKKKGKSVSKLLLLCLQIEIIIVDCKKYLKFPLIGFNLCTCFPIPIVATR